MLLDKALTRFMNGWIVLVIVLNLIAILGLWAGLLKVQNTRGLLNMLSYFAEIIALSPAFGAFLWREYRSRRRNSALD